MRPRALIVDRRRQSRGQALVETAILLPILLILLLGAIDFGRLFFNWVNLHQAVRIGANFASTNPDMDTAERDRYEELISADLADWNCPVGTPVPNPTYSTRDGTPTADPELGDYASLTLECEFSPITPLGDVFFGSAISMSATSTFPIREGCINCPEGEPVPPPPTPLQCRLVPDLEGMSVAGARLAWRSAGFDPASFTLSSGSETSTVDTAVVDEGAEISNCEYPTFAIFSSSVLVTVLAEVPGTGCEIVPNVIGITLADAEDAWTDAGFSGTLTADGGDPGLVDAERVVTEQATDPVSTAGVECIDPATPINLVTGDPWPAPPPAPCRVPNMINLFRSQGESEWVAKGFSIGNFSPNSGTFKIRSQSLVGGTYVPCEAAIVVEDKAN